jgi:hypothetical protein
LRHRALPDAAEYSLRANDLFHRIAGFTSAKLRCCAECLGEPKRGIGRNAGLLAGDPLDSRPRQAADLGKSACRHFEQNEELLP